MNLIQLSSEVLRIGALVAVYFITGFGPGFIIGLLLANRFSGKDLAFRPDKHRENIKKAAEHNNQWHPSNPKWK